MSAIYEMIQFYSYHADKMLREGKISQQEYDSVMDDMAHWKDLQD